jgi:hypothetical protein
VAPPGDGAEPAAGFTAAGFTIVAVFRVLAELRPAVPVTWTPGTRSVTELGDARAAADGVADGVRVGVGDAAGRTVAATFEWAAWAGLPFLDALDDAEPFTLGVGVGVGSALAAGGTS